MHYRNNLKAYAILTKLNENTAFWAIFSMLSLALYCHVVDVLCLDLVKKYYYGPEI